MSKNKVALFLIFAFSFAYTFPFNETATAATRTIDKPHVEVSANIGEGILEIFGYASPNALIVLEGRGIYEETISDKNGYFVFKNRRIRIRSQEVCLRAFINNAASSQPTCFPIPAQKHIRIGPIILPPIISMNKLSYSINDFAVIQGSAVPNTAVIVKLFSTNSGDTGTSGVSLPELSTQSTADGTFSINIPSNADQRLRFYAQTSLNDINSGKSTTLTVDIFPLWVRLLRTIGLMFTKLKDFLPLIAIILELGFLIWFFFVRSKRKNELMIVEDNSLLLEEHPLVIQNKASDDR
jgi:hypothetical protein